MCASGLTKRMVLGRLLCALRPVLAVASETSGDVAQLGERCLRTAEVGGSNPLVSTKHASSGRPVRTGRPDWFLR